MGRVSGLVGRGQAWWAEGRPAGQGDGNWTVGPDQWVMEVQEGERGRHQKQHGGLLCFLEAKGLFFNPVMVGLVLLILRGVLGLGS